MATEPPSKRCRRISEDQPHGNVQSASLSPSDTHEDNDTQTRNEPLTGVETASSIPQQENQQNEQNQENQDEKTDHQVETNYAKIMPAECSMIGKSLVAFQNYFDIIQVDADELCLFNAVL